MAPKFSLSTAALCAALLTLPLLPRPTDPPAAQDTTAHHPAQNPPPVSMRDSTVFTPTFGGANLGNVPGARHNAE
jgi:hypothetical protein